VTPPPPLSSEQQQQWFYSIGGERFGPVGFDYLLDMAKDGQLDPRNDLVWSNSLNEWAPAGHVGGLFERVAGAGDGNRSSHDLAQTGDYKERSLPKANFAGTGRIGYLFGMLILPVALVLGWQFALPMLTPYVPEEYAIYLPFAIWPLVGLMILVTQVRRFHNLCMSGWWILGFVVPLLNIWLSYRCFACPAGYDQHKKLDWPGTFVAFLYWGSILGSIGLVVATSLGYFSELKAYA
jgi:uncharacterized membrane protein YhaH (DUF805 family)